MIGWGLLGLCLVALVVIGWWFQRPAVPVSAGVPVVVDGSNVMHWAEGVPRLETVALVVDDLAARGYAPLIFFDANVGYKVANKYMGPHDIAHEVGVSVRQVRVVPSGVPADPVLIERALANGARVVSNDRFMDWRDTYPAIRAKKFLIKGRVVGRHVELRL